MRKVNPVYQEEPSVSLARSLRQSCINSSVNKILKERSFGEAKLKSRVKADVARELHELHLACFLNHSHIKSLKQGFTNGWYLKSAEAQSESDLNFSTPGPFHNVLGHCSPGMKQGSPCPK